MAPSGLHARLCHAFLVFFCVCYIMFILVANKFDLITATMRVELMLVPTVRHARRLFSNCH